MVNPVGFRFRPTDEEIVDHYLRSKNQDTDTSHVDLVISTVDICSFDPWELPSKSMIKSRDRVWFFFGVKENKYNRGDQQRRTTNSGFWKKTGKTISIIRKRGNRDKIGEKRVLVFKNRGGSKSDWVMHEYHAMTLSPPNQMMTYSACKVEFKGDESEISSYSSGDIENNDHSLIPLLNNSLESSPRSEGSSYCPELQNPSQLTGFLEAHQETQLEDAVRRAINNISTDDWNSLFNDDEQSKIVSVQDDRNNHTPQKPLTSVFSDDNDSDLISPTTISIETLSTCDSFGCSDHCIDQTKDLQKSPKLVSLTQKVSQAIRTNVDKTEMKKMNPCNDARGTEIGEHKLGQQMIKNKKAGFLRRMLQKLVKKIHQCSSISRT